MTLFRLDIPEFFRIVLCEILMKTKAVAMFFG